MPRGLARAWPGPVRSSAVAAVGWFGDDCSAIAKNFSDARGNFGGVVADSDDGIRADLGRMLNHDVERVAARLFTHLCPDGDVTPHDLLKRCAERCEHIARSHDDAAYYAQRLRDVKIRQVESSGRHLMRHRISFRANFIRCAWGHRVYVHDSSNRLSAVESGACFGSIALLGAAPSRLPKISFQID